MSRRWCTRVVSGAVSGGGGGEIKNIPCWVCLPHLRRSSGQERGAWRGVAAGAAWAQAPAVRAWASAAW